MDEFDTSGKSDLGKPDVGKSDLAGEGASLGNRRPRKLGETAGGTRAFGASSEAPLSDEALDAAADLDDAGWPDRKYSFNALVAVGIVGFFAGRLLSR